MTFGDTISNKFSDLAKPSNVCWVVFEEKSTCFSLQTRKWTHVCSGARTVRTSYSGQTLFLRNGIRNDGIKQKLNEGVVPRDVFFETKKQELAAEVAAVVGLWNYHHPHI